MKEIPNKSNKYEYFYTWQDESGVRKPVVIIKCTPQEYCNNEEKLRIINECGLNINDYDISFADI